MGMSRGVRNAPAFASTREFCIDARILPVLNANGVAASSPGLRGTRYPGNGSQNDNQPQRGCGLTERGVCLSTMKDATALRKHLDDTSPLLRHAKHRPVVMTLLGPMTFPWPSGWVVKA